MFGKKKRMIDVVRLHREGKIASPKPSAKPSVETDSDGFVSVDSLSSSPTSSSSSESSSSFSTESDGYSKREVDSKLQQLDTQIYKLEQRIELLERKLGVDSSSSVTQSSGSGNLIGW